MKEYNTYKESGIDWIGEIPSHWEVIRFNYLFTMSRGLSITKQDLKEEGVPCVNYGEIHSKFGFKVNPEIHSLKNVDADYLMSSEKSLLGRGDFVFADTSEDIEGSGNFTWLDSDIPTFAGYHTIIARQRKKNNYRYLAYFFDSLEFRNQVRSEVSGIKVFSITQSVLKNSNVLVPIVHEQIAIADYLDKKTSEIDALIADKKSLLELYVEEKTAIISQMVTKGIEPKAKMKDSGVEWLGEIPEHWEVKKFKYFFRLITDKKENDLPKIGLENIESKTGRFVKTDAEFDGQGIRFKLRDILFGKLRPYLSKVWLSEFEGQAVGDFYVFRTQENILPEFAKYRILDSSFINIVNSSTYGSKMPRVSWEFVSDLFIAFPNLKEQQSIVRYIEAECTRADVKIAKTKKLIELLTEYRTALISEVVTGKIKVID